MALNDGRVFFNDVGPLGFEGDHGGCGSTRLFVGQGERLAFFRVQKLQAVCLTNNLVKQVKYLLTKDHVLGKMPSSYSIS